MKAKSAKTTTKKPAVKSKASSKPKPVGKSKPVAKAKVATKPKAQEKKKLSHTLVLLIVQALLDKKVDDLRVLDVSKLSSITDYLVLATGNSDPHLRALRIEVERVLDDQKAKILGVDTTRSSGWTGPTKNATGPCSSAEVIRCSNRCGSSGGTRSTPACSWRC